MIIDVHSHFFPRGDCFSPLFVEQIRRVWRGVEVDLVTDFADYWNAAPSGVRTVVFGGKARLSGLWVDDADVTAFAKTDVDRYIPFMSLDPTQPGWRDEMRHGHEALGLRGIKLMPMYAGFFPQDPTLDPLWSYAQQNGLPVLLHSGTTFIAQAPIDCTLPRHLDQVATKFPDLKVILAHLGHPYGGECIAIIRKHPNVYADISALHFRPWQLFHMLMLVQEYNVWDKLLFGTDFPFTTVNATIEALRSLSTRDIGGFRLNADNVEAMIHRDTLHCLGLE